MICNILYFCEILGQFLNLKKISRKLFIRILALACTEALIGACTVGYLMEFPFRRRRTGELTV